MRNGNYLRSVLFAVVLLGLPGFSLAQSVDGEMAETHAAAWFVADEGSVDGPYSDAQLLAKYKAGDLSSAAHVSKPGAAEWLPVQDVLLVLFGAEELPPLPPQMIPQDEPQQEAPGSVNAVQEERPINVGRYQGAERRAAAGLITWGIGQGLTLASPFLVVAGLEEDGPFIGLGIGSGIAGGIMVHVGSILSVVAEIQAKEAVGQHNRRGLGRNSRTMSSGFYYGMSWAALGMILAGLPILDAAEDSSVVIYAGILGVSAMALRGMAAIIPLVRIRRYRRDNGSRFVAMPVFTPTFSGLTVGSTF